MSKIIVIDASGEACSVALSDGDKKTVEYEVKPRQHAKLILPMVSNLLSQAKLELNQLDAIACHVGPGAFTGIRIAVSAAQGLAYGASLPTIALSSLTNLALQGWHETGKRFWLCAIDARMQEVYFSGVQVESNGKVNIVYSEQVISPDLIDFQTVIHDIQLNVSDFGYSNVNLSDFGLIGNGWQAYADIFFAKSELSQDLQQLNLNKVQYLTDRLPNAFYSLDYAESLLEQNQQLTPEMLQPVYLRNNVAKKPKNSVK